MRTRPRHYLLTQIREDKDRGVFVDKARSVFVGSAEEMMDVVLTGSDNRRQAATGMNADSSRSHSVLMVTLTQRSIEARRARKAAKAEQKGAA